jgi:hypothetical protein
MARPIDFKVLYDSAGHYVTGISFLPPIPWPRFDGGGTYDGRPIVDRIQDALEPEEKDDAASLAVTLDDFIDNVGGLHDGKISDADSANDDVTGILRNLLGDVARVTRIIEARGDGPAEQAKAAYEVFQILLDPEFITSLTRARDLSLLTSKYITDAKHDLRGFCKLARDAKAVL